MGDWFPIFRGYHEELLEIEHPLGRSSDARLLGRWENDVGRGAVSAEA